MRRDLRRLMLMPAPRMWGMLFLLSAGLLLLSACASSEQRVARESSARMNAQQGMDFAQRGEFDQALVKLKRALREDDRQPAAHAAIAYVYSVKGDAVRAEEHYRVALRLSPNDPALKNNFGVFLCSQARPIEAEEYFAEAANDKRYGTPEAAWTNAGTCFKNVDPAKAEAYLRRALKIAPDYREALAQMASISFAQQDYLRTRAFLERYDLSGGPTAELLHMAAISERKLGDTERAERYERQLRRQFPAYAESATFE